MTTVADAMHVLEEWAPPGTALSYDNVGLQVGRRSAAVTRILVALDLTPAVVDEAVAAGAELIVTHHPVLFRPLGALTDDGLVSSMVLTLAERGIAVYAAHTNLDTARDGVSFALAHALGLVGVDFLAPSEDAAMKKLVIYGPPQALETVREAIAEAGAGRIGAYEACAFVVSGIEQFRPTERADPYKGGAGTLSRDEGWRIDVDVPARIAGAVVQAARAAHPYEEMAYDLFSVDRPDSQVGLGAVGALEAPEPLDRFLNRVCRCLGTPAVRFAGDPSSTVRRVAVCGGSGGSLLGAAQATGADAFVTADLKYHQYFDVLAMDGTPRMALVDAGHYETEAMAQELLAGRLREALAAVDVSCTRVRTSPMHVHVGSG